MPTPTPKPQSFELYLLLAVFFALLLAVGDYLLITGNWVESILVVATPMVIALDKEQPGPTASPQPPTLTWTCTAPSYPTATPTLTQPLSTPTDTPLTPSEATPTFTSTATPAPSPVPTPAATLKPTTPPAITNPRPPAVEMGPSTRALIHEIWDLRSLARVHHTTTRLFSSVYFPLGPDVAPYSFWDKFESPSFFTTVYYGYPLEGGGFGHYTVRQSPYFGDQEYLIVPNIRETQGPGAITFMWFAYKSSDDPNDPLYGQPGLMEWGRMGDVGNIRIYIDGQLAINAPITDFLGGRTIPPIKPLLWHHAKNGGNGCLLPITYNRTIEVATTGCPRWFTIGITRFLGPQPPLETLASHPVGSAEAEELGQLDKLWTDPLIYPDLIGGRQETRALTIPPGSGAEIWLPGSGTIAALRFEVPQGVEDQLSLEMYWDQETTPSVSLPFRALFGRPEKTSPYRSFATGIVPRSGLLPSQKKNLFYSNFPMPFQNGARIVIINSGGETAHVNAVLYLDPQTAGTRFTVRFSSWVTLDPETPEYQPLSVNGSGRLAGLMLHSAEFDYDAITVDPPKGKWKFCFVEANITIRIDDNPPLYFSGWEDITGAGSYWNSQWNWEGIKERANTAFGGIAFIEPERQDLSIYRYFLPLEAPEFIRSLSLTLQHGANTTPEGRGRITLSGTFFLYLRK